jgi:hypothetical protein
VRKVLAGTLVVVALAVAGCGGGSSSTNTNGGYNSGLASKSAQQIILAAVKATDSATFYRINGNVTCEGQPVGVNVTLAKTGSGAKAALTISGKPVQLIVIGKDAYLNTQSAVWAQFPGVNGAAVGQYLNGRWLKFPVTNPKLAALIACAGPKALLAQLKSNAGSAVKKGETTYNGQSAVQVDGGANSGTIYVATNGNAYPVAIVIKGKDGGTIKFSGWNQPFANPAPTDYVDISQLPASAQP